MKLFVQPHNTASDSIRIALALKNIPHETLPLARLADERPGRDHPLLKVAPPAPVLVEEQRVHIESLAIIEYLDELYPDPPLLPGTARDRLRVRAIAQVVMCDVDPYLRISAREYRETTGDADRRAWPLESINAGFQRLEAMLAGNPATGKFCLGDSLTLADICLAPLIWNAERLGLSLARHPTVRGIYDNCLHQPEIEYVALGLA